ncbi:MAG: UDP-N-acetylmuramoyl-L-alanyl-D-glutamate--2,6-diaminopimelate ligase [Coriobacteriales bacterium]|jgi:UDP-N-acetylmuramoyl-L-alanyl-D-glutamate--2,6-diaminopimelate ligase|nr:UDP-N-acetylmuramoyl-L-alanyl-D-glutamate--2,6-diaminopimelate ligase [Coriobacteriales bacterium]
MTAKSVETLFAGQDYTLSLTDADAASKGSTKGSADDSLEGNTAQQLAIQDIAYRSDAVRPGSIFFCVVGAKSDGHHFAADAAARGAVALAVQHPVAVDLPQVTLANTRLSLALSSSALFDQPSRSLSVVGITGTNGKTTTSYLVDWILRQAFKTTGEKTGLIGTVETRIGSTVLPSEHTTPESYDLQKLLSRMQRSGLTHVTMEVSSHAIALDRVAGTEFAVVAFSNLTQDHLDFHPDMESYFNAKAKLFASPLARARVIDIDGSYGARLAQRCTEAGHKVLTCGFATQAAVRATQVSYRADATQLTVLTPQGEISFSYPLIGSFNVSNVLLALAISLELGLSLPGIVQALEQVPQIPGRLERVLPTGAGAHLPVKLFVDYAHTPDSISKALAALAAIRTGRMGIVFGCGGDRDASKRPLMGAAARAADFAVVTSDNPRSEDPLAIIADILPGMAGFEEHYTVEPDRRRAIACALAQAAPGDFILLAGKGHEDYQLVGQEKLTFDDRVVAAQEMDRLATQASFAHPSAQATLVGGGPCV